VTAMRVELATCLKQFCFSTTRHFFWRTGEWKLAHVVSPHGCGDFSFVRHLETQQTRPGLKSQK